MEKQWTTSDPIYAWEQYLSQQGYILCDELAGSLKPFEIGEALAEEMHYPSLSVHGNGV